MTQAHEIDKLSVIGIFTMTFSRHKMSIFQDNNVYLSNELLYKKMLAMLPLYHENISRLGKQNLIFKQYE